MNSRTTAQCLCKYLSKNAKLLVPPPKILRIPLNYLFIVFSVAKGNQKTISMNRIPICIKNILYLVNICFMRTYQLTKNLLILTTFLVFSTRWFNKWFKENKLDEPKSRILIMPMSNSKTFSSLMSRCTIFWLCITSVGIVVLKFGIFELVG